MVEVEVLGVKTPARLFAEDLSPHSSVAGVTHLCGAEEGGVRCGSHWVILW